MVSYTRLIGLMDVTIDINDIFNKITYAKPTYNKIKPIVGAGSPKMTDSELAQNSCNDP